MPLEHWQAWGINDQTLGSLFLLSNDWKTLWKTTFLKKNNTVAFKMLSDSYSRAMLSKAWSQDITQ